MSSIAVTGASGFIGSNILKFLRESGQRVSGLTRGLDGRYASGDLGLVRCDYLDAESMAAALTGYDVIVHIAGLAHGAGLESAFNIANTDTAVSVALAARAAGSRRIVLLSSAGILGQASPIGGFSDDATPQPYDSYTRSKHLAERRLEQLQSEEFGLIALRPPMVYGRGAPGSFRRLSHWINRGWPLPLASVSARRSVIGVNNLCEAIFAAATAPSSVRGAFLVADERPVVVSEFIQEMASAMGRRVRVISMPPRLMRLAAGVLGRTEDLRRLTDSFELSGTKARTMLGWAPRHSTKDELARALGVRSA